jgi:hypothetical protein
MQVKKSRVWNIEGREGTEGRKERNRRRNSVIPRKPGRKAERSYQRKSSNSLVKERTNRKELEVTRKCSGSSRGPGVSSERLKKRRETERDQVRSRVKTRLASSRETKEVQPKMGKEEWKEQVVRVGTGFRVRRDEKDPRKRRFDVGYSDLKTYQRKEGREVTVESSNMGRTIVGKGKDARVKVMNAVGDLEKRRPVSEYTGSGILRKSLVGKRKLKPTKAGGKE